MKQDPAWFLAAPDQQLIYELWHKGKLITLEESEIVIPDLIGLISCRDPRFFMALTQQLRQAHAEQPNIRSNLSILPVPEYAGVCRAAHDSPTNYDDNVSIGLITAVKYGVEHLGCKEWYASNHWPCSHAAKSKMDLESNLAAITRGTKILRKQFHRNVALFTPILYVPKPDGGPRLEIYVINT